MTYVDLERIFSTWIHFEREPNELLISVAVILANRLDSVPIWLYLVGPASSLKSTILKAMEGAIEVYMLDQLTENTLVSGFKDKKNRDMSVLPQLNRKVVVMKDFTTILNMRSESRNAIFGQLRGAYDGFIDKGTGVGMIQHRAKFGILAGVTGAIEMLRSAENVLGERFMYFRNTQPDSNHSYSQIMQNIGRDSIMGRELKAAMNRFLNGYELPIRIRVNDEAQQILREWVKIIAILRTSSQRDFKGDIIVPVTQSEFGGRLFTQIITLYFVLIQLVNENRAIRVVKRIALNSVPETRKRILIGFSNGYRSDRELQAVAKVSRSTVYRTLEELRFLDIIDNSGRLNHRYAEFLREVSEVSRVPRGNS